MGQHSCWPGSGALAPETPSSRGGWASLMTPPPRERPLALHCPFRKSLSAPAPSRRSHTRGGTGVTAECEVRGQAPPALLLGPESGGSGRQGPGPTLTGTGPLAWSLAPRALGTEESPQFTCHLQHLLGCPGRHTQPRGAQISPQGPGQAWQS